MRLPIHFLLSMQNQKLFKLADLGLASALGLLLLIGCFIRVIGDAGSAAFGGKIIEATLAQPIWGTALSFHLAAFVGALALVHLALGFGAWILGQLFWLAWPNERKPISIRSWIVGSFALLAIWILLANAAWFPKSSLGAPYAAIASAEWLGISVIAGWTAFIASLILASTIKLGINHGKKLQRLVSANKKTWTVSSGMAAAIALAMLLPEISKPSVAAASAKPHVIIVGLDSLRSDALGSHDRASIAPAITDFLSQSAVFTNTITPLARTFPAWVSILTGRHPHTTGAVINLFPRERIDAGETLAHLLSQEGYNTAYAIDEVRFSNLDESYGFSKMVSPPIGSADFLLGFFSDTPLSNILVNTRIGSLLFPYAHANRAVTATYDPDTFIEQIDREITFDGPTFLTAHLTLAHWPYSWATSADLPNVEGKPDSRGQYQQAVGRLDQQFKDLMDALRRKGALDNAIVVVLSDHGESLGEPEHAHIPEYLHGADSVVEVYGHGTNVFSHEQYEVILGMRSFGNTPLEIVPGSRFDDPASLEDVTPTIVDALNLSASVSFDGVSLLPLLNPAPSPHPLGERIRFMETEFNPPGVSLGQVISASALRDASEYYRIDPKTDRILIREEFLGDILANRQYAASRNGKMLALVPVQSGPGHHAVLINGTDAEPVWISKPEQLEADPAAQDLWVALQNRFPLARRPIVPLTGS